MRDFDVRTPEQALLYITDCQLATVDTLAMKKSRGEADYARQKSIAQKACNWIKEFKINPAGTRVEGVFNCKGSVEEYILKFDVKKGAT
jgi:hypothetical protein